MNQAPSITRAASRTDSHEFFSLVSGISQSVLWEREKDFFRINGIQTGFFSPDIMASATFFSANYMRFRPAGRRSAHDSPKRKRTKKDGGSGHLRTPIPQFAFDSISIPNGHVHFRELSPFCRSSYLQKSCLIIRLARFGGMVERVARRGQRPRGKRDEDREIWTAAWPPTCCRRRRGGPGEAPHT